MCVTERPARDKGGDVYIWRYACKARFLRCCRRVGRSLHLVGWTVRSSVGPSLKCRSPQRFRRQFSQIQGLCCLFTRFYLSRVCQRPALYFKEGALSHHVLKHVTLLQKPYRPTFWAVNAHIQTTLSGMTCSSAMLPIPAGILTKHFLQWSVH